MKLSYCDRLDQMRSVMKTKHDNDLTDRISAVYIENYTELSRPIRLGTIYMKMRQNNNVTNLIKVVYVEKEFELS